MSLQITGELYKVFPAEQKTESFTSREFVIRTDGQYPQYVKFQLTQDRTGLIDLYREGQEITVHFDLRGRPWTNQEGKEVYFTILNAWRLEGQAQAPAPASTQAPAPEPAQAEVATDGEADDDLPF